MDGTRDGELLRRPGEGLADYAERLGAIPPEQLSPEAAGDRGQLPRAAERVLRGGGTDAGG